MSDALEPKSNAGRKPKPGGKTDLARKMELILKADMPEEQFTAEVKRHEQKLILELAQEISECKDDLTPMQKVTAYAILRDKRAMATATVAPAIHNQTNIQVNGYSKEDIAAMLTGKKPQKTVTPSKDIDLPSQSPAQPAQRG